jgi:hypothetical protein
LSDPASLLDQDDEIERPFDLVLVKPEEFPQIAFDSIPVGRLSDLFLHHDAQPVKRILILLRKKDEIGGGESLSCSHHPSEILGVDEPLSLGKSVSSIHDELQEFRG